jgi:hypothetical protein
MSENSLPKKADQLHLVASMIDDVEHIGEQIASFKADTAKIPLVQEQVQKIFLYHSKDDGVVPYSHTVFLKEHLP